VILVAAVNWTIYSREQLLAHGTVVLLELAPVDPRSLMQGDYMALRFKVEADAGPALVKSGDGHIVVRVDERGVGQYLRRLSGESLGEREVRLRYRVREGRVKFATNAFFFEEGTAQAYTAARFGEFRVAPSGELLLTGLRDEKLRRLGPRS
jgi:uncharacterized membrane-anchored protein